MTSSAVGNRVPIASRCGLVMFVLFAVSACGTTSSDYSPGQLDEQQFEMVREVVKAFVQGNESYPELRDELLKDPVASRWFVRDLESRIVRAREGQAELLGEEAVRADRVREVARQPGEPVKWNLPGQRPDNRAIAQIVAIGKPAVEVVVNDLALSSQEFLRSIGVELLIGIGDPAVPALLEMANTGDLKQQRVAARALGEIGAVGVSFDALRELAQSSVWRIRSAAATGLANGGPEARDLLVEMLADEDPFVRRKAGDSLARYKDPVAATALVDFLESCKESGDLAGELAAQKALQAIAGSKGPRASSAWRRFVDEMPRGEDGR